MLNRNTKVNLYAADSFFILDRLNKLCPREKFPSDASSFGTASLSPERGTARTNYEMYVS